MVAQHHTRTPAGRADAASATRTGRRAAWLRAAALAGSLALATAPATALAQRWLPERAQAQGFAPRSMADRRISLEQAVAIAQQRTGGRVLDARDQGRAYRIKLLTRSGEVVVVYVDAQTGALR
jgi:uncharacterized membrane protein YkoI